MKRIKSIIILFILIIAFFITATPIGASIISISPGQSIQIAINNANPGDIILLQGGTYYEHDITINKGLTIQGEDPDSTTIDASMFGRVFYVNSGVVATIYNVKITNGKTSDATGGLSADSGGGIINYGDLRVRNSIISNNETGDGGPGSSEPYVIGGSGGHGGGIANYGMLIVENSTVSNNTTGSGIVNTGGKGGNGGGIFNGSSCILIIQNSTVSGNIAGSGFYGGKGGGIHNNGNLKVQNSTISSNASGKGPYIGNGGGIFNSGLQTIENSTISYNIAGISAAYFYDGDGGGVFSNGTSNVKNSIIANNILGNAWLCSRGPDFYGTLTSYGYNLIEDISYCTIIGDSIGNILGFDPNIGPLLDNGGPTMTHALLLGSPAINRGSCVGIVGDLVTIDQRGYSRKAGFCDIGSFEYYSNPKLPMDKILKILKENQEK